MTTCNNQCPLPLMDGRFCTKEPGHDGMHGDGKVLWGQDADGNVYGMLDTPECHAALRKVAEAINAQQTGPVRSGFHDYEPVNGDGEETS